MATVPPPQDTTFSAIATWVMGVLTAFSLTLLKVLHGKWVDERTDNKARIASLEKSLVETNLKHLDCEQKHTETKVKYASIESRLIVVEDHLKKVSKAD
jgi:hypothetical protein